MPMPDFESCLSSGWDGYRADPVKKETMANAERILALIEAKAPAPDVYPNPNGTISFEWDYDGATAVLEIGLTKYSFFIRRDVGPSTFEDGTADYIDTDLIIRQINDLHYVYGEFANEP